MGRSATLLHRGEHFRYEEDGERFEGQCVWAWTEEPTRTYPITIEVRSIRATSGARLTPARRRAIAEEVKRILEAQDPSCTVRLDEG